jgi:hypothetical protein
MWSYNSRPSIELLPSLLEKIDVLLFAGDLDAMCNWVGIQNTIDALEWQGATGLGVRLRIIPQLLSDMLDRTLQSTIGLSMARKSALGRPRATCTGVGLRVSTKVL